MNWPIKNSVTVTVGGYLMLALGVLMLPLRWLGGLVLAGFFHELCHVLAIRFTGGQIIGITIGFGGTIIETETMTAGKELVCALAGPVGGFLLLALLRWLPHLAFCGAIQSVFNLLPIYPLDGGRAMNLVCRLIFPPKFGRALSIAVTWICVISLMFLGIYGIIFLNLSLLAVLPGLAALFQARKFPCFMDGARV